MRRSRRPTTGTRRARTSPARRARTARDAARPRRAGRKRLRGPRGRRAAGDGKRRGAARAASSFDALEPQELAQLYRLMSRLAGGHADAADAPPRARAPRASASTCGARCAAACAPAAIRSASRAAAGASRRRRLVMLCDISGSMEPYARAYLQFLTCAAGSGPNAEAFVFATRLTRLTRALAVAQPGARDPARRRGGAGLVERHADRRRAEGVQRPARAPRHGARSSDRDPLRRLGARRPAARGPRDGAPGAPGPPDRVGQPAGRCRALLACSRAGWWPRCRTATRS